MTNIHLNWDLNFVGFDSAELSALAELAMNSTKYRKQLLYSTYLLRNYLIQQTYSLLAVIMNRLHEK